MNKSLGLGTQFAIELKGCDASPLSNVASVENAMLEAAKVIGATVLSSHFHQFEPHGVSGVLVISESHFAVHTWPEHGYAALDLFTCGDKRLVPYDSFGVFEKHWGAVVWDSKELVRGKEL